MKTRHDYRRFVCFFISLACISSTLQAEPSSLAFISSDELFAAHHNIIHRIDITAQKTTTAITTPRNVMFDTIAYNNDKQKLWATIRHGIPEGGTYHDLLIIPTNDPSSCSLWQSEQYWPHWNHCANLTLAPHGNQFLSIKRHAQTRHDPTSERQWVHETLQQLSLLSSDLDIEKEITFEPDETMLEEIRCAEVADDASVVLIKAHKGLVALWNPHSHFSLPLALNTHHPQHISTATLSGDGQWAYIATTTESRLFFLDKDAYKILPTPLCSFGQDADYPVLGWITDATFSENNRYLCILSRIPQDYRKSTNYGMIIFDLKTQTVKHYIEYNFVEQLSPNRLKNVIEEQRGDNFHFDIQFNSIALSPDGNTIATLSHEGVLRLINADAQTVFIKQLSPTSE